MSVADTIERVLLTQQTSGIGRDPVEQDVVTIEGVGGVWGIESPSGELHIIALSSRYKDDWGSTQQQRIFTVDDPTDESAVEQTIIEGYRTLI